IGVEKQSKRSLDVKQLLQVLSGHNPVALCSKTSIVLRLHVANGDALLASIWDIIHLLYRF
ncbi:MAG: hypothetical protein ABFD08_01255, partial [Syntrophomonas sp.]